MLYRKPKHTTLNDYVHFIEKHGTEDTEKLFQCLYMICYLVGQGSDDFPTEELLDDFSIKFAEKLFTYICNKKQLIHNNRDKNTLNILEFVKTYYTKYSFKYLRESGVTKTNKNILDTDIYSVPLFSTVIEIFTDFPKQNESIRISCCLTLANYISNQLNYFSNPRITLPTIENSVVLYNLSEDDKEYITLLSTRLYDNLLLLVKSSLYKDIKAADIISQLLTNIE